MKETIYTIPINEAFDLYEGCPLCVLYNKLEYGSLEYTMGASMMEPDVRVKTNEQGFCHRHLQKMLAEKNKLSLALMIESHLPELSASLFSRAIHPAGKAPELKKIREAAKKAADGCYICSRISLFMGHYYKNIFYLWRKEPDFREKFRRQLFYCIPHYAALLDFAEHSLPKKQQAEFAAELTDVCKVYLTSLSGDISEFCKSFDYRNAGRELGRNAQTAADRAAAFLTGVMS